MLHTYVTRPNGKRACIVDIGWGHRADGSAVFRVRVEWTNKHGFSVQRWYDIDEVTPA